MPAIPEFAQRKRKIGAVEVAHQVKAHDARCTNGNIAVGRKVAVKLHRKKHGREQQRNRSLLRQICIHAVHQQGKAIGDHQFLNIAPQHLHQPRAKALIVKVMHLAELRQHIAASLNGARHQLRKKADKQRIAQKAGFRLHLAPVYIGRVANGLENIKADAHRQQKLKSGKYTLQAECMAYGVDVVQHKAGVFEQK